ncbi:hypothetical protein [Veillonella magna]|nr:hypothetical protein [Veillonella magna]
MTHMGMSVTGVKLCHSLAASLALGEIEFDKGRCGSYNSIVEVEL